MKKRVLVAITGASGVIYGIRLLEELKRLDVESHLVLSDWGKANIEIETSYSVNQVEALADCVYDVNAMNAAVASGSFLMDAMVIVPCSMKTLSAVASGFSYNLIARAADVTLKERRPLIVVPRETPLSSIHLRNMLTLSDMGAVMIPPSIGFYSKPETLDDVINHIVGKVLDALHIQHDIYRRWGTE